ncbi:MAG TPA: UDP-N-acetylmuramoyl-tripeptide--D-alanyl-D-alanine ligase [Spirochaetia bacterium]|nr:UDP-N-acetylmuramoyl-tripeptide--D-alanyl-D-alanine ligase [Spirochaetia bacterium]
MTQTGASAKLFTVHDAAQVTGGRIVRMPSEEVSLTGVSVDSRRVGRGFLFVALPGERTNGHEFLGEAAAAEAAAFLVSEQQVERRASHWKGLPAGRGPAVIAVPDTLKALQDLARFRMRTLPAVRRVGITGSSGKTTTKEILGSILTRAAPTAVNEGNLNSEIGLPLACFAVEHGHTFAVFEMGMNHRGEMDVLADIVRPDMALLTNIGTAHIGLLGSQEEIAKEKKRIFAYFDERQVAFLPEDERFLDFLSEGVKGKIILFGPRSTGGYRGSENQGLGGTLIHWEGFRIRFPLFGPHNLANALGAISVARELGVPSAVIRDGLEAVTPLFGRSQILRGPVTVIVDCYNANPDSLGQALSCISDVPWKGRKIVVLGGMRELGAGTPEAHRALGERLRDSRYDLVYLLGAEMEQAWKALAGSVMAPRTRWFPELAGLGDELAARTVEGDLVLLKGSRGLEMERLLPFLVDEAPRAPRGGETGA